MIVENHRVGSQGTCPFRHVRRISDGVYSSFGFELVPRRRFFAGLLLHRDHFQNRMARH